MKNAVFGPAAKTVHFLVLSVITLLSAAGSAGSAQQTSDQYHTDCVICHRTATPPYDEASVSAPGLDLSAACMDCHHYSENHHPVSFVPEREIDSRFPLFDGEVQCLTCHQGHGTNGLANPKLLRGGPYADRREICTGCHIIDQDLSFNPHIMTGADGSILEVNNGPVCLICHNAVPDQTTANTRVTFRADVAFLCWRCHPPMPGSFLNIHFQVRPRRKTLAFMKQHSREQDVDLPLLNRDRITCSTCHNPHQAGIIRKSSAAAGADSIRKLRLAKELLCTGCHQNK